MSADVDEKRKRTKHRKRNSTFWETQLGGKIRRLYLTTFRRKFVKKQVSERKGQCRQCGACCQLWYRCPFLTKNNTCMIYGGPRPESCKFFPIDRRDLKDVGGACGFQFSEKQDAEHKHKDA